MKILSALIFILSLYTFAILAQASPPPAPAVDYAPKNWSEFISVEDAFKARFPRQAKFYTVVESASGVTLGREYYDGSNDFILYQIRVIELPPDKKIAFAENPKKAISEIKNEEVAQFGEGTKIIAEKSVTSGSCPANIVEYDVETDLRYRILYVFCNDKFYRASVRTFRKHSENAMGAKNAYREIADAFLQAFTPLTKEETGKLKSTEIKLDGKFFDQNLRFGIEFPAAPKITREINGDKSSYDFAAESNNLIYSVEAKIISDEFSLSNNYREIIYNGWRDGFLEDSKAKLLADKKINLDGIFARDLILQLPPTGAVFRYRLIAVDGKFYILWILDSQAKKDAERDKFTAAATEKFFDSFEKLSEFNPPKYVGVVQNNSYSTDFYNFSFEVPKNWTIKDGQLIILSSDKNGNDTSFDVPKHSKSSPIFLVATKQDAATKKFNTLQFTGKYIGDDINDLKAFSKEISDGILEADKTAKLTSEFSPFKVGGKEIWQADFETTFESGEKVKFKNYFFVHNNYWILINGFYFSENEKAEIENSVKSLQFFRGK